MAEDQVPISKARAKIANLAKLAQTQMRRYVLTHQGVPQAVLLGSEDYRSLKAAAELAHRPEVIENILSGQSQVREGKTIALTEVKRRAKAGAKQSGGGLFILSDPEGAYSQQDLEAKLGDLGLKVEKITEPVIRPVEEAHPRQFGKSLAERYLGLMRGPTGALVKKR